MTDERLNLPSASAMPALALCLGRWRLTRGLPDLRTKQMEEWGDSGEKVHLWLESADSVNLTREEERVGKECIAERDKLLYQVIPTWNREPGSILSEKRLWLADAQGRKRFSGRIDFAAISHSREIALVVDYKTNRGEQDSSDKSLQLRSQAVLIKRHWPSLKDIYVAMVQPLAGKSILCRYGETDLQSSLLELEDLLARIEASDAPVIPGKTQCNTCPARLTCDAAWKEVDEVASVNPAFLDPAKLSVMLDRWLVCKAVGKLLESEARKLLAINPEAVPNWGLKPGGSVRYIEYVYPLCQALRKAGFIKSPKEFIDKFCTVGIGDLENGIGKEAVQTHCATLISKKPKEPSLERK